jgi:hypothetical protein
MAWTSPMTAVSGDLLTASEYNTHVRDNFNMLAPALARTQGSLWLSKGSHQVAEYSTGAHRVLAHHNIRITQTQWTEIQSAGPFIAVRTGDSAIVTINAELMNANTNAQASATFEVSGATTIKPSDDRRITHDGFAGNRWTRGSTTTRVSLNPGLNMFRMKYRTGRLGPVHFRNREIIVLPL